MRSNAGLICCKGRFVVILSRFHMLIVAIQLCWTQKSLLIKNNLQSFKHLVRAYELPTAAGRIDTTSVSVYHGAKDHGGNPRTLLHFGHSKDAHPERRQFIEALATLDRLAYR